MAKSFLKSLSFSDFSFYPFLFAFAILVWIYPFFPSQDGLLHLANAKIVLNYHFSNNLFSSFYHLNDALMPNWFLVILMKFLWFFPSFWVEKIFLTAYLLLFPLSFRYWITTLKVESPFLPAVFVFATGFFLFAGFYHFCASFTLFFALAGFWNQHYSELSFKKGIILSLGLIAIYYLHPFSLGMFFIYLLASALADAMNLKSENKNQYFKIYKSAFWACVPAFLLLLLFLYHKGGLFYPPLRGADYGEKIKELFNLRILCSFERPELWGSFVLSVLTGITTILFISQKVRVGKWNLLEAKTFIFVAVCFLTYLFPMSETFNDGEKYLIRDRLVFFGTLFLMGGLGFFNYSVWARKAIMVLLCILNLFFLGLRVKQSHAFNQDMKEYTSFLSHTPVNAVVLPVSFEPCYEGGRSQFKSRRACPLIHAASVAVLEKQAIVLDNYQASLGNHFPVIFREDKNPLPYLEVHNGLYEGTEHFDLESYQQKSGEIIDYVLLSGTASHPRLEHLFKVVNEALKAHYQLVFTSSPRGIVQLYERKKKV